MTFAIARSNALCKAAARLAPASVLNTDWGDRGHWQHLPISYAGYAYCAALSWYNAGNVDADLPAALDAFAFGDSSGIMGKLAADLGNTYQQPGVIVRNGTATLATSLQPA